MNYERIERHIKWLDLAKSEDNGHVAYLQQSLRLLLDVARAADSNAPGGYKQVQDALTALNAHCAEQEHCDD